MGDDEVEEYGGINMLLNPTDRYLEKKGKLEGKRDVARNLLDEGFSIEQVVRLTGLSKEDILNAK